MPIQTQIQIQRIRAIELTVSDIDRSIYFYTQALGFTLISDQILTDLGDGLEKPSDAAVRMAMLQLGDEQIELMQYLQIQGKPIPPDSRSNDLWFQHLAIVVSDMDRAYAHLQLFPIEPISSAPQTFPPGDPATAEIRAFKFKDPDRHDLELIWFPPQKGQQKWHQPTDRLFLGIDHTAITIGNTEQSLLFYRDLLGMRVDGGSFNWREIQSRLDGVPHAQVRVTALRPTAAGPGIELLEYVSPGGGRAMPQNWRRWDIGHMHVDCVVNDLTQVMQRLQHSHLPFTPASLAQRHASFRDSSSLYRQGYCIQDPAGHTVLLTQCHPQHER